MAGNNKLNKYGLVCTSTIMAIMVICAIVLSHHNVTKEREVPYYKEYNVRANFEASTNSSLLVLDESNADTWAMIPGSLDASYNLNINIS